MATVCLPNLRVRDGGGWATNCRLLCLYGRVRTAVRRPPSNRLHYVTYHQPKAGTAGRCCPLFLLSAPRLGSPGLWCPDTKRSHTNLIPFTPKYLPRTVNCSRCLSKCSRGAVDSACRMVVLAKPADLRELPAIATPAHNRANQREIPMADPELSCQR